MPNQATQALYGATCCGGTGYADYAAVPCPDPACPVPGWRKELADRIRKLMNNAECTNCGTTENECSRLYREHQGEPPPVIGCCFPHRHIIDPVDVFALADRVQAGASDPLPRRDAPDRTARFDVYSYLGQGEVWRPKAPAPPVLVASMDAPWRWNASQWLLRGAKAWAWRYGLAEVLGGGSLFGAPDEVMDDIMQTDGDRLDDPQGWMRTTALYRALVADLPAKGKELAVLADRARHWSMCTYRIHRGMCTCVQQGAGVGPAPSKTDLRAALAVIKAVRAERHKEFVREMAAAERALTKAHQQAVNERLDADRADMANVDEFGHDETNCPYRSTDPDGISPRDGDR